MKNFFLISGALFSLSAIFTFGYYYVMGFVNLYEEDDEKELRLKIVFILFLISCFGVIASVILSAFL